MIVPIIVPPPVHSIPRAEVIYTASLVKYNNGAQQEAFRAGAKWADGPPCSGAAFALALLVCMFVIVQLGAAFYGILDGRSQMMKPTGKWAYVFPLYTPANKFSCWMSK